MYFSNGAKHPKSLLISIRLLKMGEGEEVINSITDAVIASKSLSVGALFYETSSVSQYN